MPANILKWNATYPLGYTNLSTDAHSDQRVESAQVKEDKQKPTAVQEQRHKIIKNSIS